MKKVLLLLAIAALAFASCSSSDDDDDFGADDFYYDVETLYGTWGITHLNGVPWLYETTSASFYPDGTYSGRGYFGNGSGTYKLSRKEITCYVDGKEYVKYYVQSITGNKCVLLMFFGGSEYVLYCERK